MNIKLLSLAALLSFIGSGFIVTAAAKPTPGIGKCLIVIIDGKAYCSSDPNQPPAENANTQLNRVQTSTQKPNTKPLKLQTQPYPMSK
jgi:hypothetical protein